MKLSKDLEDIYQSFVDNNKDFVISDTKEGAISDIKQLAKSPNANFSIHGDNDNLLIVVKSFKIIYLILYLIIFGLPLWVVLNNFDITYLTGFIVYTVIVGYILGREARTINKLQFDFNNKLIKISNINFLGQILFRDIDVRFDEIQDVVSKEKRVYASSGSRTYNRIFIKLYSDKDIPIIDLNADKFRYINEKRFIGNLIKLIKTK